MVMEDPPSPNSVGREFVRQYYTLLNKAPTHLHRYVINQIPLWSEIKDIMLFNLLDFTITNHHLYMAVWIPLIVKQALWLGKSKSIRKSNSWIFETVMLRSHKLMLRQLWEMVLLYKSLESFRMLDNPCVVLLKLLF